VNTKESNIDINRLNGLCPTSSVSKFILLLILIPEFYKKNIKLHLQISVLTKINR